jgi:hypothetical protein
MKITKQYIQENLLTKTKGLNSMKLKKIKETIDISNEELYLIYNEIDIQPLCICGEPRKFNNFKKGYQLTCGNKKCSDNHPERIRKIQENLPKNIGILRSEGLKKRTKEDINFSSKKVKETKKKRYNDENFVNTHKAKETIISKYGVESYFKTDEFKKKAQETKLSKYGSISYNNPQQIKKTRELRKEQGVQYTHEPNLNTDKMTHNYILENFIVDGFFKREEFMSFFGCKETFAYKKIKELNINYKKTKSYKENEINKIFGYIFKQGDRTIISPLEIDLYSPKYKFGIEYNGLVPHSYGKHRYKIFNKLEENKNYHLDKTLLCEEKDIQLYHIFENEWLDENKKTIWISIINDKLGKNKKIGARKCIIKEVSIKDAKQFIDENHIQGYNNSSIKIGLYYEDYLVSIMTFGKPRFNKKYEYELIRFCTKKGYTIQGGGSKLLRYFEREYKPISLISYANRRWSIGNFYSKTEFKFIEDTKPNYFYFKPEENILYSRNKFQKHKLKNLLEDFNLDLTETKNMYNNGYRKIYDSGNKVFVKEYQ